MTHSGGYRILNVSHKHVILSETLAVTSIMRKNSRWASSTYTLTARDSALAKNLGLRRSSSNVDSQGSVQMSREGDLMAGFQELKRVIRDVEDVRTVALPILLSPFFAIIRSSLSTGPITSAALSALHSFFVCGLISTDSPSLDHALVELSNTVSHCKFEASDSSGDEVVLLKIMTVIEDCMCHDVGMHLGDAEICEMLETVLTTCCQMRLSETLRRSAESTMHSLVRTIFSRLHALDAAEEEERLQLNDVEEELQEGEIKMSVLTSTSNAENVPVLARASADIGAVSEEVPSPIPIRPYGLPAVLELLRVLVNILDPNDQVHTDSTRLTDLGILNIALEVSGNKLSEYPSLLALIVDPGCKFLFQLARSENSAVLQLALRTISTVFETLRVHLKLQQELFLAFTIDCLTPPPIKAQNALNSKRGISMSPLPLTPMSGTPVLGPVDTELELEKGSPVPSRPPVTPARGETRELMLEILSQISSHPSCMVDLYSNYDCDINCENLFERLMDFLTKGVYPLLSSSGFESHQLHSQYICLDLLLAFVNDMAARVDGVCAVSFSTSSNSERAFVQSSEPWPEAFTSPEELMQNKSRKKLVLMGAARFNAKPKNGIMFLEENKLIYADPSPKISKALSLAMFLKNCTRIDKRLLGDFISKPENTEILKAFIGLFDFKEKPIADAMREMLETFRLPGESQQIARITETFASIYFASHPAEIKNEDAVYILAYSVIMLNTDLHNPQIRRRMTIEDYQRNLRGVNDGSDFSSEFLQNIYDSIRKREIIMPEEHTGQLGFEYAWKELSTRSRQSGPLMTCNTSLFDLDMFKIVWKPLISAIAYAFISFEDDYVIQRAISGFRQCATLAHHFQLPDVFDFVVVSLSQATTLLSDNIPVQVPNYPVVDIEGQSITVSSLSIKFGTNFKGQLAAVVLFNIVNGNGNALREGWTQIFEMFQNLFLHSLLPTRMLQMEDFLGGVSMIPLRGSHPARSAPRAEGGLLSALSSYLMTPYSSSSDALVPEATDSDIEKTLCTIDCITSCRLDELYAQIMQLEVNALVAAVSALEALAHERTIARLEQDADDIPTSPNQTNGSSYTMPYDPASVFLLEMMVSIASQTTPHIERLWPVIFQHLSTLLASSTYYSVLLIERAVVGLLRLCHILAQEGVLREQIYISFDLLVHLPSSVATSVAEQVVAGLGLIIERHRDIISSQQEWSLVCALLSSTISNPEAARVAFNIVAGLTSDGPQHSIAGISLPRQQRRDRHAQAPAVTDSPVVERGRKAIDLLFDLKKFFTKSMDVPSEQAWQQYRLPLISTLGRQSTNASRFVRHAAITQLQRILLGPHLVFDSDHSQVEDIFKHVIFPLFNELFKPQIVQLDPQGMSETRLRAAALLCKAFMHFEVREDQTGAEIQPLWMEILDRLNHLIIAEKNDQVHEAVSESLKNVVLVMNAANILIPPTPDDHREEQQRIMWTATQQRLELFLPGFLDGVIPTPVHPPPPSSDEVQAIPVPS